MVGLDSNIITTTPLKLSVELKSSICKRWNSILIDQEEHLPKKTRDLIYFLISNCDTQGVLFGTVEQISKSSNIGIGPTRKVLRLLEQEQLIRRKNGIIILFLFKYGYLVDSPFL